MKRELILALTAVFLLAGLAGAAEKPDRPNIVLIMVDDMGFSDIGCYGGEIDTPNLNRLAAEGLRFSQFYNCAKCETTRATLLSGRYHPEVGIREMKNCVTIAEAMRPGGYTTLMTGKWHLTSTPCDRGFDRYFGHLSGATNFFWGDNTFLLDKAPFTVPKQGFYTTDADTDYAIRFLKGATPQKPFFLYIAYNAPHYPLQAPEEEVKKYRGRYLIGWDELRRRRYERMKELHILKRDYRVSPRPDDVPAWDSLTDKEKNIQDLMMATFAGMIDRVDQNIGRLRRALEETGRWDNTLLLFLSDNGACPFQRTTKETLENMTPPWDPRSFWTYDKGWAHACNTPFREYKRNQHEGGISTPLIVHWPDHIVQPGSITRQTGHLVDIMTTCLDVAGIPYPAAYQGRPVGPARGLSLAPIFAGRRRTPHEAIYFNFYGKHEALRAGDWKLVRKDEGPWELYDMDADRTELNDLSGADPERFEEMQRRWREVSSSVVPPPGSKKNKAKAAKKGRKSRGKL